MAINHHTAVHSLHSAVGWGGVGEESGGKKEKKEKLLC